MAPAPHVPWSDTIFRLYNLEPGSALEERFNFSRLTTFPAALANWPGCLGTPGIIQLIAIAGALLTCHFQLRNSELDTKNKFGIWVICFVLSTLLTNFAIIAWLSRNGPT